MSSRLVSILALVAILAAAGFALFRPAERSDRSEPEVTPAAEPATQPQGSGNVGEAIDPLATALPPNHPPIGDGVSPHGAQGGQSGQETDAAAIVWKAPASWKSEPNPNTMRIATYRVPRAAGDSEDGDVSVTRAGGSTNANIDRWVSQFEGAGAPKRVEKTVHGYKVTVVSLAGSFAGGGMMGGAPAEPRPNWALAGAIVETPGTPYFFKMTGPSATVGAARASFDALLDSITPAVGGNAPAASTKTKP
jgi:hypothetical protein